jgi:hypothetical protein
MTPIAPSPTSPTAPWPGCRWAACRPALIAPNHLDTFAYIGVFSGGSIAPADVKDIDTFKQKVKLVFVSYGSREVDPAARPAGPRRLRRRSKGQHRRPSSRRRQHPLLHFPANCP